MSQGVLDIGLKSLLGPVACELTDRSRGGLVALLFTLPVKRDVPEDVFKAEEYRPV